jgi:phage baseplate assembly protein V
MSNTREMAILLARQKARWQIIASRGVASQVDDTKKIQRIQATILDGEIEDDIEVWQPYGTSFVPIPSPTAETILLAIGADRSHTVALCVQDGAKRPKGTDPGTGGLYTGEAEWRVYIDTAGVVHIGAKAGAEFIAQAQKTQDQFDKVRQQVDKLTDAFNQLSQNFTTFTVHTHLVATAGSPAAQTGTAAPAVGPPPPIAPVQPPLGAATTVAATKGKVT